jgi:hypothetical protein
MSNYKTVSSIISSIYNCQKHIIINRNRIRESENKDYKNEKELEICNFEGDIVKLQLELKNMYKSE